MSVVRVEGVTRSYRAGTAAVDGVSLTVEPGEIVGVRGPSGCGKSTLLRLVAGLERPDAGSVIYDGTAAWPGRRPRYPRPGYVMPVFQDPYASLDPRWPIWRTITEPLLTAGRAERRAYAEEQLARIGLDATRLDARPGELSGGQRQRAAVLRALAARPALLVADEPASRQDVVAGAELGELFATAGTAVLVVSHDEAWLSRVATRILTIAASRLCVHERGTGAAPRGPARRRASGRGRGSWSAA